METPAHWQLSLSPLELLDRLAALIPPPRRHRHHYHGVFAPHAALRAPVTACAGHPVDPLPLAAKCAAHPSPPSPARLASLGPEAHHAAGYDAERFYPKKLLQQMNAALKTRFNVTEDLITAFAPPGFYLDRARLASLKLDATAVESVLAEELRKIPGVAYAYTRSDLLAGRVPRRELVAEKDEPTAGKGKLAFDRRASVFSEARVEHVEERGARAGGDGISWECKKDVVTAEAGAAGGALEESRVAVGVSRVEIEEARARRAHAASDKGKHLRTLR